MSHLKRVLKNCGNRMFWGHVSGALLPIILYIVSVAPEDISILGYYVIIIDA